MQDFRKRRSRKAEVARVAIGSIGVLALASVAFFSVRGAYGMYQKFADASAAQGASQAQLASLEMQYNNVSGQVEALGTPEGQEAQLRERYGVVKPGEGEIDIVQQSTTTSAAVPHGENWFERIWHALFIW